MAVTLGQLLVIGVGGYLVIEGQLTLGTLVAFVGLLPTFFQPIAALADVGQTVQTASGAMDRMHEMLDEPITIADQPGAVALPPVSREIRLEDVDVRLRAGPADPARPRPDDPRRQPRRDRRPVRVGQEHDRQPAAALLGPDRRAACCSTGTTCATSTLASLRRPDRPRLPGHVRLRHDAAREHRPRPRRRDRRRGRRRGRGGAARRLHRVAPGRLRHRARRAGRAHERRPAPAARDRPGAPARPGGPDPRRGDERARRADRGGDPRDARGSVARGRTTISITHRLSLAARSRPRLRPRRAAGSSRRARHAELARAGGLYQRLYDEQTMLRQPGSRRSGSSHPGCGDPALRRPRPRASSPSSPAADGRAARGRRRRSSARATTGATLYLVASGQRRGRRRRRRPRARLNTLDEGDYFGEMALLTGEPRAATVRATMPTELYGLSRSDFAFVLEHSPEASRAVEDQLATRARAAAQATIAATRIAPLESPPDQP